ncbi:hypothetical protein [Umezawaea sp. Da 62-37]|uniref:hypothetical protein n=1 Tax=Umezawaea sp. Da 62-37 TaxID=3075927 RepID=UPI0028F6FC7E|nr:hypothetical protein [Umezawaea sp. Da 62-37]WNV85861.1 hypothetical protein RM788_48410 [Umezawaea sp. Da 62-37]
MGERLDAIRCAAEERGVAVVVDLHGKPVDLSFTRDALRMRPVELTDLVRRLTADAAASALAEGMAVVNEVVPESLFAD